MTEPPDPPLRGDRDVELDLVVEETRELRLAGLGTAGFVWGAEVEEGGGVVAVRLGRVRPEPGAAPGRSTAEVLTITAQAPGAAIVRLRLARPWESTAAPRAAFAVTVRVAPTS